MKELKSVIKDYAVGFDKDWRDAKAITAGVDIGSTSGNVVIMADNQIIAYSVVRTGASSAETANRALELALKQTDLKREDIQYYVSTGYGRVIVPFANKSVTEIACHARGANWFSPKVRTILDMGGQDCKAIRCDEKGKVVQFLMNDKCAAGTGRSMEVMSEIFDVPIAELGARSLDIKEEPPAVSSTCTVFARSEALMLLREGWPVNEILAAYCSALANRVVNLVKRIGVEEEFAITGGIAKNVGVVKRVEERLGVKAYISEDPQIVGALGAALFAQVLLKKSTAA